MSSRAPVYTNDADIRFFEHQPADCVAGHGPNVQHCRLRGSKDLWLCVACVLRAARESEQYRIAPAVSGALSAPKAAAQPETPAAETAPATNEALSREAGDRRRTELATELIDGRRLIVEWREQRALLAGWFEAHTKTNPEDPSAAYWAQALRVDNAPATVVAPLGTSPHDAAALKGSEDFWQGCDAGITKVCNVIIRVLDGTDKSTEAVNKVTQRDLARAANLIMRIANRPVAETIQVIAGYLAKERAEFADAVSDTSDDDDLTPDASIGRLVELLTANARGEEPDTFHRFAATPDSVLRRATEGEAF